MRLMRAHRAGVAVLAGVLAVCPCAADDAKTARGDKAQPEALNELLRRCSEDKELGWGLPRSDEERPRVLLAKVEAALRQADDRQLEVAFRQLKPGRYAGPTWEFCLSEIARRGGQKWEAVLSARLRAMRQRRKELARQEEQTRARVEQAGQPDEKVLDAVAPLEREREDLRDLELLTVLRRVQKRHDPVMILLSGKSGRCCDLDEPPVFDARLTNVDVQGEPIHIQAGGDYRSGRQARWRIEVRDAKGRLLPEEPCRSGIGGGILDYQTLKFGESWETRLRMPSFVEINTPGEYTVRILYHDQYPIADFDRPAGLVCCRSVPIELRVFPVTVKLTDPQRRQFRKWIGALPKTGQVTVFGAGRRHKEKRVQPSDRPEKDLFAAGWKVVLDLAEAATDPKLAPVQRAWVLGLLYSITGFHNPRFAENVIGPHEFKDPGYAIWSSTVRSSGGSSGFVLSFVRNEKIDPAKQREFAKRWQQWLQKNPVRVEEPPANQAKQAHEE